MVKINSTGTYHSAIAAVVTFMTTLFLFSGVFFTDAASNNSPALTLDDYIASSPLSANALTPLGGNTLQPGDDTRLVIMAVVGDAGAGFYQSFPATNAGVTDALNALREQGHPDTTYVMYIGASLTAIPAATFGTGATGTFASLQGSIKGLVLTGSATDPVTTTVATAQQARRFERTGTGGTADFGTHLHIRNIGHDFGGTVNMHGHDLTLGGNSWQTTATTYRGGGATGNIAAVNDGTVRLTVHSTGSGTSTFVGGMDQGTLQGNTAITITGSSANTLQVYGGGVGTSTNQAHVTGSTSTTITGMATNAGGLQVFFGGAEFGSVGIGISNHISGPGRWAGSAAGGAYPTTPGNNHFVGGFRTGTVGPEGARASDLDTSDFIND